jgi:alpha-beta hydrolase superfamily lysophospholipase
MPVEYQSAKQGVNAQRKHRAFRFLFLALGILSFPASAGRAETVSYSTSDQVSITADFYRGEEGRGGIVLFHRNGSQSAALDELASALVLRGFHVLAPDLRGHGRSESEPRAPRAADSSPWLRDGPAAVSYLRDLLGPDAPIGLVGIERGAEIAARAMSAGSDPRGALVLLDPDDSLTGLAILQSASDAQRPVLIVAGRDDPRAREAARALFLLRPTSQLWLLDGGARIVDRLLSRDDFADDLATWMSEAARR